MSAAVNKLIAALEPAQVDAFLVVSGVNRRYLTGFPSSAGWLLITRDGAELLVDSRYIEAATQKARNCTVLPFKRLYDTLKERLAAHGARTIMTEQSTTTLADWAMMRKQLEGYTLVDGDALDKAIGGLRQIKTAEDLDSLRKAQKITDDAFAHMLTFLKPGVSELDAALEIEFFMRKRGAERIAFDLIVVSGENSSMPHGVPGSKLIQPGDFITMDTGCVVGGMHSDMTRTVAVGYVTEEQRKVYNTVLRAQENAIAAVRAGVVCKDVDEAARSVIRDAGYGPYFGHSTGHSVGYEIHETPNFAPTSEVVAEENMVLTIEPGIYLPGRFGVRIEDMVRVTRDGCEDLTYSPKDLIIL